MTPDSPVRSRTFVRRERALAAAICAILAGSVVINLALFLTARSGVDIVWSHDARFLRSVQGADSWKAMETARAYARTRGRDIQGQLNGAAARLPMKQANRQLASTCAAAAPLVAMQPKAELS